MTTRLFPLAAASLVALAACEEQDSAPTPSPEPTQGVPAPSGSDRADPDAPSPEEDVEAPGDGSKTEDSGTKMAEAGDDEEPETEGDADRPEAVAGGEAPPPGGDRGGPDAEPAAEGDNDEGTGDEPEAAAEPEEKEDRGHELGDKKVESQYAAWLQGYGSYQVGKPSTVQAVLMAKGGYKCNDAYPYKFKISGSPTGVTFPSTTVRNASVGTSRTSITIPFTPTSTGSKTIRGTFHFSVCNESTCKIEKQSLSVTVDVGES